MQIHSHQAKIAYSLAGIPAVFLPLSYLLMAVSIFTSFATGKDLDQMSGFIRWIVFAGFYATLIQWPFYFFWAARTSQLTFRVRMLWIAVLFLLNMFAIPYFLFCMYRGTAQTALTRSIRHESIRRFFENGTVA
jgi:O-antigen/teichoic acid export membrane protein